MIGLIGFKRVVILMLLSALLLAALLGYFTGLQPLRVNTQTELDMLNSQMSDLRTKIGNIKKDMAQLKVDMPKYKELQEKGFFRDQDRFMAGRILEDLRKKTAISAFSFDISQVEDIANADAADINYRLIRSRIKVDKISSLLDTNIYIFLQNVPNTFPEHTLVRSFDIRRTQDVNEEALKKVAAGEPVSFVDASITFDWLALVPKTPAQPDADNAGGGTAGFRGR